MDATFCSGFAIWEFKCQQLSCKCCAHLCAFVPLSKASPNIICNNCQFQSWCSGPNQESATPSPKTSNHLTSLSALPKIKPRKQTLPMNDIGCLTMGCTSFEIHHFITSNSVNPPPPALVPCAEPKWCPWWWSRPPGSSLATPNRSGGKRVGEHSWTKNIPQKVDTTEQWTWKTPRA